MGLLDQLGRAPARRGGGITPEGRVPTDEELARLDLEPEPESRSPTR